MRVCALVLCWNKCQEASNGATRQNQQKRELLQSLTHQISTDKPENVNASFTYNDGAKANKKKNKNISNHQKLIRI